MLNEVISKGKSNGDKRDLGYFDESYVVFGFGYLVFTNVGTNN